MCDLGDEQIADFVARLRPVCRGNPESHYLLACYYQDRGDHKKALEEFKKVISIDPWHVDAYNRMGVSYDNIRDFQHALKSYKIALSLKPSLHYVYNNLGYSYMLQSNIPYAIESYKKAVELNGSDKQVHNNLGMAYALNKQFYLAFEHFRLAGGEAAANYNLAQLYYRQSMYFEAKKGYQEALVLSPKHKPASDGLERCKVIQSALTATDKQDEGNAQHTHSIICDREGVDEQELVQAENGQHVDSVVSNSAPSSSDIEGVAYVALKQDDIPKVDTDTHIVKKDEYIFSIIRKKYNISGKDVYRISRLVRQLNPQLKNPDLIYPGQKLLFPSKLEAQMKTASNLLGKSNFCPG
jgi:tetratricopeptide (TPR) repeat protein